MLEAAYGREMNILATALVDIPAVSMPIPRSLKTWDICAIVLCDKNVSFSGLLFIPTQGIMILLLIQLLDMPHLPGGKDYLGKGEMLTKRHVNKFVHDIWE